MAQVWLALPRQTAQMSAASSLRNNITTVATPSLYLLLRLDQRYTQTGRSRRL
jgi:hypothetical protein